MDQLHWLPIQKVKTLLVAPIIHHSRSIIDWVAIATRFTHGVVEVEGGGGRWWGGKVSIICSRSLHRRCVGKGGVGGRDCVGGQLGKCWCSHFFQLIWHWFSSYYKNWSTSDPYVYHFYPRRHLHIELSILAQSNESPRWAVF